MILRLQSLSVSSPIGTIRVTATERGITELRFDDRPGTERDPFPHLAVCIRQLGEYFAGDRKAFEHLPLAFIGTEFSQDVWARLLDVPYGATRTYGQIAEDMKKEGAARAVGGAVGRNPLAIIVPCHRILPSDGSIGGFAWGEERKKWLLEHERNSDSLLSLPGRQRK